MKRLARILFLIFSFYDLGVSDPISEYLSNVEKNKWCTGVFLKGEWRKQYCNGMKEYENGKKQKAIEYFEKSCNEEDEDSIYGCMWQAKTLMEIGFVSKSLEVLRSACEKGSIEVCNVLGSYYREKKDYEQAKNFLGLACKKIDNASFFDFDTNKDQTYYFLGLVYWDEYKNSESKDLKLLEDAYQNFNIACEEGGNYGKKACYYEGLFYKDGLGNIVDQDFEKALEKFEESCKVNGDACYQLALIYKNGLGVDQDHDEEQEYYEEACEKGNANGCLAIKSPEKACDYGSGEACFNLAELNKNPEIQENYYNKACEKKNGMGCKKLGEILVKKNKLKDAYNAYLRASQLGITVDEKFGKVFHDMGNKDEAKKVWSNSCENNNDGKACFYLAEYCSENEHDKKEYIKHACELNNAKACELQAKNEPNQKNKIDLLDKACNLLDGSSQSCFSVGIFVAMQGESDSSDEAYEFFKKACDKEGGVENSDSLSCIFINIEGKKIDEDNYSLTEEVLSESCNKESTEGRAYACYKLAEVQRESSYPKQKEMFENYNKSCEYGYKFACETVGKLYEGGFYKQIQKNLAHSALFYYKALVLGLTDAKNVMIEKCQNGASEFCYELAKNEKDQELANDFRYYVADDTS